MQYYSILSSIPNHIKKHIRENLTDYFNTFNPEDIFLERIKNNKDINIFYISLVNNIVHITMQKFLKWEEKHQCDIPNWFIYFNILRKCCKNVYLINFQYKFLHRVIPTNTFLFKIHVKDSKSCSFCTSSLAKGYDPLYSSSPDGRMPSDGISSRCLWQGKLKT